MDSQAACKQPMCPVGQNHRCTLSTRSHLWGSPDVLHLDVAHPQYVSWLHSQNRIHLSAYLSNCRFCFLEVLQGQVSKAKVYSDLLQLWILSRDNFYFCICSNSPEERREWGERPEWGKAEKEEEEEEEEKKNHFSDDYGHYDDMDDKRRVTLMVKADLQVSLLKTSPWHLTETTELSEQLSSVEVRQSDSDLSSPSQTNDWLCTLTELLAM